MINVDGDLRGLVGEREHTNNLNEWKLNYKYNQVKKWFALSFPTFIKIFSLFKLSFVYIADFLKLYPLYIYYKYFKYGIFPIFYKPSGAFKYIHFFKVFRNIFKLNPVPRDDWLFYTHSNIYFFKIEWNNLSRLNQISILLNYNIRKKFKNELIEDYKYFLHREDGPAKISKKFCKIWAIFGEYHREDGPAVECKYLGYRQYFVHDKLHREDGPALEYTNNVKKNQYWINGKKLNKREFISKTFKLNIKFD